MAAETNPPAIALLRVQITFCAAQIAEPRMAFAVAETDAEISEVEVDVRSESDALTGLTVALTAGVRRHDAKMMTVSGASCAAMIGIVPLRVTEPLAIALT